MISLSVKLSLYWSWSLLYKNTLTETNATTTKTKSTITEPLFKRMNIYTLIRMWIHDPIFVTPIKKLQSTSKDKITSSITSWETNLPPSWNFPESPPPPPRAFGKFTTDEVICRLKIYHVSRCVRKNIKINDIFCPKSVFVRGQASLNQVYFRCKNNSVNTWLCVVNRRCIRQHWVHVIAPLFAPHSIAFRARAPGNSYSVTVDMVRWRGNFERKLSVM